MIICGYAGIGKSWLAHKVPNVMDLESTPFEKDWDRYVKCAIHYHNNGHLVLVSCHKELREKIEEAVVEGKLDREDWLTIVPAIEDKEVYRKVYTDRYNTIPFIEVQMTNWEKWVDLNDHLPHETKVALTAGGERLFDYLLREGTVSLNYKRQCPTN